MPHPIELSRSRSRQPAARTPVQPIAPRVRNVKLALVCLSMVLNAMSSGAIFTFPLLAPQLARHLRLTQPQLSTIALAGMMGQYPFAALIGSLVDRAGPAACSLLAAGLLAGGLGAFSNQISHAPPYPDPASPVQYYILVLSFAMLGLGAVSSYFASLVCASKNFPDYPGAAAGTSMALFGFSPLVLSLFASSLFTTPDGLDVTRFTAFVAALAGATHIFGALTLQILPPPAVEPARSPLPRIDEERASLDERSALLPKPTPSYLELPPGCDGSVRTLLTNIDFWILAFASLCALGICETIIANIGTVVLALPASLYTFSDPITITATQVRLISITNTVSRLVFGFLADFTSPIANYLPSGELEYPRKSYISRVLFLVLGTTCLSAALAWMLFGVSTQSGVWVLSVGAGTAYGGFFAILPGLVSSIFGARDFARNFGIISYSAFIGTPIFTYIYAFNSEQHTSDGAEDGVCKGEDCFRSTFWVCEACALATLCGLAVLWKRWQGRV
ncbi:MFS general substrate transporter [Exidia glandulosa HHB12029]|uniref:MFS general substrate transporter n=1 Tax=Exidia glandulosa HHB12029 TaxID=1314781 RepID=A0A165DFB9_EXIGL|nr:MFS general substrate transporter [Exidia glandulosa HHB12029]